MTNRGTIRASHVRSKGLLDFSRTCDKCGRDLKTKGVRGGNDGLSLCMSCRTTDKQWIKMVTGGGFCETTDEELERLERELEALWEAS